MPAGELRESVTFQQRIDMFDDYGNTVVDFVDKFTTSARIQPHKGIGNEAVAAARLTGTQPMIIRVRQSSQTIQVNTDWRIIDRRSSVPYNIESIANMDEKNAYLDMLCISGTATG